MDLMRDGRPHHGGRAGHHRVRQSTRRRTVRGLALSSRRASAATRCARVRVAQRASCAARSEIGAAPDTLAGGAGRRSRVGRSAARDCAVVAAAAEPRHRQPCRQARRSPTWPGTWAGRAAPCSVSAPPCTATVRQRCGASCGFVARCGCSTRGLPYARWPPAPGYADQPHLHREVRDLAGVPLAALRQDQRREQIHPVAVGVGHRRIAHAPRRVVGRQRTGVACRGDLFEERVDLGRGIRPRTPAPAGCPMTSAAPSPDACRRWSPRCRKTGCCRRAVPPPRAVRSTRGWPGRAVGRTPATVARRWRRSERPSMSGECPCSSTLGRWPACCREQIGHAWYPGLRLEAIELDLLRPS